MARKLFDGMEAGEAKVNSDRKDYKSPKDKPVEIGLTKRLIEHYERDYGTLNLWKGTEPWKGDDFEPEIQNLESMIIDAGVMPRPQALIDALTFMLRDESDCGDFTRTEYVGMIIQALYNLDYNDEFTINIRGWPEDKYPVGFFLKGKPDMPLILNLYGGFGVCGFYAEYCNFTLYDKVEWCGYMVENCTFSMLPDADAKVYTAPFFEGNRLRRLNDRGEVMLLPTFGSNMYQLMKLIPKGVKLIFSS